MGTIFSSDDPAVIGALAKAIAREVVRELTAAKQLHVITDVVPAVSSVLQVGPIVVDIDRHEATVHGRVMNLKPREFELLLALMRNAGKVLTREMLLELAWREAALNIENDRTIDVHVLRLRKHLDDESGWLQTIAGRGYKLNDR
jgi:DNA-binding response OmpR family regulator